MRKKRFSLAQLLLAIALTAAAVLGCGLLAVRAWMGEGGRSLVEGLRLVNTLFVGEYDETEVVDAALEGMVSGLGDRWSYYLTADELEAQNQRRTNQYVGVGITVNYTREEGLYILAVEAGGPAEAAGLEAGEVITAVDGVSLAGEARYEGANLIQGEAGTTVTLEVLGEDGAARTVEVERAELKNDPVESRMLEGKVGYVRLLNFYDHSAQRLEEAVTQLQEQGAEALVFDMRDNGGGYLSQLTDMLDFLLPEGPIFISRDRRDTRRSPTRRGLCGTAHGGAGQRRHLLRRRVFRRRTPGAGRGGDRGGAHQRQGLLPADLPSAPRRRRGHLHRAPTSPEAAPPLSAPA